MENRDNLILITAGFPFGKGETFLENEIEFLAKEFKTIQIIAKHPNDNYKRSIPNNCNIQIIYSKNKDWSKITWLFHINILSEIISLLFTKNGISKIKILIDQVLKANHTYTQVKKIIGTQGNSIVYSYWLDESTIAFPFLKKEFPKSKFISRAHGWDVYFERHPFEYLPLRKFLIEQLDQIFFISKSGLDYYSNINNKNLSLSYLGTRDGQANHQKPNTILQIVSCSSLIPLKRVDLMINSFTEIKNSKFQWHHIGLGPQEIAIKNLAAKLLDYSSFEFKGQLKNSEVLNFYKTNSIDLLINTSSTEGLPVSMMEAMSCGIPCIGTNVGGVSEIIEDGVNGFLLSANPTPQEVVLKINTYIQLSDNEKLKMREHAFNTWNTKFNAEKNYTEFIEEIKKL